MTKVLSVLLVVALMPRAAYATVFYDWTVHPGATDDTWTLTVKATAGETMYAFDVGVYDTAYLDGGASPNNWVNNGNDFADVAGETTFLLKKSQGATTYINSLDDWVNGGSIGGLFAAFSGGPDYGAWTGSLKLLQIVVPHGLYDNLYGPGDGPPNGVTVEDSSWGQDGLGMQWYDINGNGHDVMNWDIPIPEPSSLVLLGIGAFSLLAYAWRKRTRTA